MVLMSDIVYIILKCHCPILIVSPQFIMFLIPYYFHASIQYFLKNGKKRGGTIERK